MEMTASGSIQEGDPRWSTSSTGDPEQGEDDSKEDVMSATPSDKEEGPFSWWTKERFGVLLCMGGFTVTVPEVIMLKIAQTLGGDPLAIVFWHLVLTSLLLMGWVSLSNSEEEWRRLSQNLTTDLKWMCAIGASSGCVTFGCTAIGLLEVTNSYSLVWIHPLFSAMFDVMALGDAVPRRSFLAVGFSVFMLVVMTHSQTIMGIAVAVGTAMMIAVTLALARANYKLEKKINIPAAAACGHFCAGSLVFLLAITLAHRNLIIASKQPSFIPASAAAAVMNSIVVVSISQAPRYITSTHTGLATLLFKGCLWLLVAFAHGERTSIYILATAALCVVLVAHETAHAICNDRIEPREDPAD